MSALIDGLDCHHLATADAAVKLAREVGEIVLYVRGEPELALSVDDAMELTYVLRAACLRLRPPIMSATTRAPSLDDRTTAAQPRGVPGGGSS